MTDTADVQLTAATELPELPAMPTPPERPDLPEADELTPGQTAYLDSIIGDTWHTVIEGDVARWEPAEDDDGRPVARLALKTADGLELTVEVRPPMSAEDLEERAAAEAALAEQHDADLEQFAAARAAWEQLASEHRARAELRDLEQAHAANLEQLEAEADRFRAAVDSRVAEVLKAAGIAVPEGFGATYADAEPSPVDEPTG